MKIFFSPASPFVRKVMVVAHEHGIADRIEKLPSAVWPTKRDMTVVAKNPLGKVPTALRDDGGALYDSRVVCEYLDAGQGGTLFGSGENRWRNLVDQSIGDGILDAALLIRYETLARPAELKCAEWEAGQYDKILSSLDLLESRTGEFADRVDIGTITIGCALGYLDFRFGDLDWRASHPGLAAWYAGFSARPSMKATVPAG
ncbi:glutathione S-transferase [Aliidongia dinghuensis]|uniref:Glutathione S-transferase n=1 Tax=Aliidongia dinghuensis TaxID=1867774 RepID=A0A8J2YYU1_9PROT|nr:glutathione S-transferase [Aliidongia dinghuensis]GGF42934.1 glutathione S-transferase [Aliidongia dinghuensis]